MKVYLIGPMTGIKSFNYPAFIEAKDFLVREGFEVQSPTDLDSPFEFDLAMGSPDGDGAKFLNATGVTYEELVSRSIARIMTWKPDLLVALPGWEESSGAVNEYRVGKAWNIPTRELEHYDSEHGFPVETNGAVVYDADGKFIPYEDNPLRQRQVTGGVKDNRGKPRVDLLPSKPLLAVGRVLGFGATKYKPNNWRLGLGWSDTIGSSLRHILAFADGEDIDAESGECHVDNAITQLLFLSEYYHTKTGIDDRWASSSDHEEAKA